jgi:F-type H+-transporting ATPase subunit b
VSNLKKKAALFSILICALMLHLMAFEAFAADGSDGWRVTFDLIMRWANFLILAALLIKFGRVPVKSFLESKKQDISDEIKKLENEKKQMIRQIDKNQKQLENSQERLSALKKRIIAQGEKNKQKIIDEAEQESKILLANAKRKINSRIMEARETLKSELIDTAVALAMERLPEKITDEVNQRLIDAFISNAAAH